MNPLFESYLGWSTDLTKSTFIDGNMLRARQSERIFMKCSQLVPAGGLCHCILRAPFFHGERYCERGSLVQYNVVVIKGHDSLSMWNGPIGNLENF